MNSLIDIIIAQQDELINLSAIVVSGLFIRFLLQIIGQNWVKTFAHTATLLILPIITYVIVKVISGNIALSLGMVGALSIVRFRNPVRSPLELTTYFAAITIGIAASVSLRYLALLVIAIAVIGILLIVLSTLWKVALKKDFFNASFSEGNMISTLEMVIEGNKADLDNNVLLKSKNFEDGKTFYFFVSQDFQSLKNLLNKNLNNKELLSYKLNK